MWREVIERRRQARAAEGGDLMGPAMEEKEERSREAEWREVGEVTKKEEERSRKRKKKEKKATKRKEAERDKRQDREKERSGICTFVRCGTTDWISESVSYRLVSAGGRIAASLPGTDGGCYNIWQPMYFVPSHVAASRSGSLVSLSSFLFAKPVRRSTSVVGEKEKRGKKKRGVGCQGRS